MKAHVPTPPAGRDGPGTLVVVASQFPEPNETFVVRELNELRRQRFDLRIFSLRPPPHAMPPEAEPLLPAVIYPPRGVLALVADVLAFVAHEPLAACRGIVRGLLDAAAALPTPILAAKQLALLPLALAYARRLPTGPCRLHAHFANVPTGMVRTFAAIRGCGYGFTAHAWDIYIPENKRLLPGRIRGAEFVVTCTGYNRRFLRGIARTPEDADKIALVHHGLELSDYVPEGLRKPGLIVGGTRLVEKKGLADLLRACARLRARGLDVSCVLVGEGSERPVLEALVRNLHLESHVRFTGWVPHRELIEYLRTAAVFAHPSIVDRQGSMDGIPNAILEAMALETPVVATRLSGIPEVLIPEETGLLVEPGDLDGLTRALERLVCDPELGRRLGRVARALVLERFDIRANVEQLARLFARASEHARERGPRLPRRARRTVPSRLEARRT
jgi:colanic acid/amylovoran biosynthesis glycosyltransferase